MVAGRIIKRVRELRQLGTDQVAKSTNISEARLIEFEEDQREPSVLQLERLSAIYGIKPYWFFGSDIPNLPELIPDFRKSHPTPARLSPEGLRKLWSAEQKSTFTAQLIAETSWKAPAWVKNVPAGNADKAHAERLRDFFDDWLAPKQTAFGFAGSSEQIFFQAFRLFMEVQGLIVNVNDAQPQDFMGFYVEPDEGLPLAFVNRSISSKKAQLFTLLHETCHHILHSEGVSDPFTAKNAVERKCNHFAAEFLAPLAKFSRLVEELPRSLRADTFELVQAVSSRSFLSRHASAIRLAEAQFITQQQLGSWVASQPRWARTEKDEEASTGMGKVHAKRVGELGYLPTYIAAIAVSDKIVDSLDVRDGLSLSEGLQPSAFALAKRRVKAASGA